MKWHLTDDPEPLIRLAIAVFMQARRALLESSPNSEDYQEAKAFLESTTWAHLLCEIDGDIAKERIVEPLERIMAIGEIPPPPRALIGKRARLELAARVCSTIQAGAELAGYQSRKGYVGACKELGIPIRCLEHKGDATGKR